MSITQRIDNITKIPPEYMGTVLKCAPSLKLEMHSACNYECSFCVRSLRESEGDMSRADYSRIIREFKAAGGKELGVFYINEPFLSPWLPEAIKEAKDIGIEYVFCTSNFAAATPAKVKAAMAAGLDSLKFSLNFDTPDQLQAIANVSKKNWRRAIDNFKAARKLRDEGGYKCKLYVSSIMFDGEQGKRMDALVEEIAPYCDEHPYRLPLYGMSGASKAAGMKPQAGNPGRVGALRDPLPCWACFTEMHVAVSKEGPRLVACCFGAGLDGELVMGDLSKQTLMEAWNSPVFQELRSAHLKRDVRGTACEGCAAGS